MKILASDFDDTLFFQEDSDKNNKNIEAIRNFINQGNIFCIITGRNYTSLKKFLNEEKIPYSYLICEDGAKIFNNVDYCLNTILLSEEEIIKIKEVLDEIDCDYYLDDGYNKTEYLKDCVKVVVRCSDKQEQSKIVNKVREKVDIHVYASRNHVNIIHKSVNKKNALNKLLTMENLNRDSLFVIGDNDNDYEMLKSFNGAVIKKHHKVLDELQKDEYENLSDYIKELMNN